MADISDINTNEPEVVFTDRDGNYAVVIAATPPNENNWHWRLGDWEMEFFQNMDQPAEFQNIHMSLMGLSGKGHKTEDNEIMNFPDGSVPAAWEFAIKGAIARRAMHLVIQHYSIASAGLSGGSISYGEVIGPAPAREAYETVFEFTEQEVGLEEGRIILMPAWNNPKYIPRPGEPSPFRWVVTFEQNMIDQLKPDVATALVVPTTLLDPFDEDAMDLGDAGTYPGTPCDADSPATCTNMRAAKRFRQTFNNAHEFELHIDRLAENLDKYQDEIDDSIWYYTYPGDLDDDEEVDLRYIAELVRDAGIIITDYLYNIGHSGHKPFEIGFQEFVERDFSGGTYGLTGRIIDAAKINGSAPGIRYIGAPAGGDKAGVRIYTSPDLSPSINIAATADNIDISVGLNPTNKLLPDWAMEVKFELAGKPEKVFIDSPFDNDRVRYFLANLKQVVAIDLGGPPPHIPTKEEAKLMAAQQTAQALQNPCGTVPSLPSSKKKTPVDEFVEKRLIPTPESNFRKQSILDFANKLAGFDLSFKSLRDIDIELDLSASDVLEEMMENMNTDLSDYIADMVWEQMPASPKKIRSLDDAWKYILARIDIPTLIAKYLACLGLDVSLNDLLEWLCDEMIRTVDQKTDGGLTSVIEFLESGEFVPFGGEYIDLSITDVVGEIKGAIAGSVATGQPAGDVFIQQASYDTKKIICAVLIVGPFAAVAALVYLIIWLLGLNPDDVNKRPPKKKCDVNFDWPDAMPLLETLWDMALKYAKKRLEEEAMEWLEEEIIKPLRDWIWQILEACGNEDEFEYGSLPPQLIAPGGLEEVAGPYFMGEEGASDFLARLLAALTPQEICLLLSKNIPYSNPKLKKVLKFIMKFTKDPVNEAPLSAIGTDENPGRLGSPANIVAFFNSIRPKLNSSICDRLEIIPNRQVSDLCVDLAVSPKESSLIAALAAQGLSEEEIEAQVDDRRASKKKLVLDAIKTLSNTGDLSEKLKKDSKKQLNESISGALKASAGVTMASFFATIPEMSKSDLNTFALVLSNAPFIRRMTADLDTLMGQSMFKGKSNTYTGHRFHDYEITVQSAEYLEAKAKEVALASQANKARCEEWRRHVALMESFQEAMHQDLKDADRAETGAGSGLDATRGYWPHDVDLDIAGEGLGAKFTEMYNSAGTLNKWRILTHSYMRIPHRNLINKYKNLTPEEFDDLAVIAFRYYSRFTHDYTNLEKNQFSKIQLRADTKPYGSFYYDPLHEQGGVPAWWGYLGNVNFRYGIHKKYSSGYTAYPWFHNPPGPDPEDKALPLYQLIQRLHAERDRNDGKYKLISATAEIWDSNAAGGDVTPYIKHQYPTYLKRYGHWVPKNPTWSMGDLKTALVQLLLFVWDRGKDTVTDFPIFKGGGATVKTTGFNSSAWKDNLYGGHLMRALQFYKWGLTRIPGYPGPAGTGIVGADEGGIVNLVRGEWVDDNTEDHVGFYESGGGPGGYIPADAYKFDEEGNIIPPEIFVMNAADWEAGQSPNGITAVEQLGGGEGDHGVMQLILLDPKTGKKAPYIPLERPTPWRIFCRPKQPDAEKPKLPEKNPTYSIEYELMPLTSFRKNSDSASGCMIDRYYFYILKYLQSSTGFLPRIIVDYNNNETIKVFDTQMGTAEPTEEKGKELLGLYGYTSDWEKIPTEVGARPVPPRVFTDVVIKNITKSGNLNLLQNTNKESNGEFATATWKKWSPYAMLDDVFNHGIGQYDFYGHIFTTLLKNMTESTVKYGIGMSLPGTDFSDRVARIISGVRELIPRFYGSGGDGILNVNDIRSDAIKKHKDFLQEADFSEILGVPTIGKTLISYPKRDPSRFIGKTQEEKDELREKEEEDTYPALIRLLVRTFVVEKLLKAYLVCGAFNVKKVGYEPIMKEFIFASMKEAGVEEEIGELVTIKASQAKGEEVSFEDSIKPIVQEEVKVVAEKIADLYKPNIGSYDGAAENVLTLPEIYDLASVSPFSRIGKSVIPNRPKVMPLLDLDEDTAFFEDNAATISNNLFTKFRYRNLDGEQIDSGFVLEKYVKIKWKKDLRKSPIGNQEFYKAWKKWPIEFRGFSKNPDTPDGEKLPVYLSVEDFRNYYTEFFTNFGFSPEEQAEVDVSTFSWRQLGDTATDFNSKLEDMHAKVHNDGKQGPGDVVGTSGPWTPEKYNDPRVSISRSAEIQRHIALMERLLAPYLKAKGHPDKQGFRKAHKGFRDEHGIGNVDGHPLTTNNHSNAIMPGVKQRSYGIKNYVGDWSKASNSDAVDRGGCAAAGLTAAQDDSGCLIKDDYQAELTAQWTSTGGMDPRHWWTDIKSDLIRWGDLSNADKWDLMVIAFRFYSRYKLGDFRAFTVNPIYEKIPGISGTPGQVLDKFFKRAGYLDRSCNPRHGLRAPGSMWYHSWEKYDEAGKSTELKGIYSISQGNYNKKRYHIPPTFHDLFKILFAQRMFRGPLDGDFWSGIDRHDDDRRYRIRVAYKTPLIQEGTLATQYSWDLPPIKDPSNQAGDPFRDLGYRYWDDEHAATQVQEGGDVIAHGVWFENLAKLLCYCYEIGDAQRRPGLDDAWKFSWATPDTWPTDDCTETGIHTDSAMGENYTALFGGHLYYALQYYKNGMQFIQELDQGAQFTVVGSNTLPTPLDIFTKDKNGESNLVDIAALESDTGLFEELEEISKKDITDFADIEYGLRLSYLLPPPAGEGDLAAVENEYDETNLWSRIRTAAVVHPNFVGGSYSQDTGLASGDEGFITSDVGKSREDFFETVRRTKTFLMKEAPDAVSTDHLDHNVFLLPLIESTSAVTANTILDIADNFSTGQTAANNVTALWGKMKGLDDFRLFFEYIFPLQRILALMIIRDALNFDVSSENLDEAYGLKDINVFNKTKEHIYTLMKLAVQTGNDPSVSHLYPQPLQLLRGELDFEETMEGIIKEIEKSAGIDTDE